MNQSTEPTGYRSTSQLPIAPHSPIRRYYREVEASQGFLNELFNRTARQYRNIDYEKAHGLLVGHHRILCLAGTDSRCVAEGRVG